MLGYFSTDQNGKKLIKRPDSLPSHFDIVKLEISGNGMPATEFGEKTAAGSSGSPSLWQRQHISPSSLASDRFPPEAKKIGWGLYGFGSRISGQSKPRLFEQN